MQLCTVYLYLETALHVSGGTSIHHQEPIQLYLQHLVFVTPLVLPAASGCGRDLIESDGARWACFRKHGNKRQAYEHLSGNCEIV